MPDRRSCWAEPIRELLADARSEVAALLLLLMPPPPPPSLARCCSVRGRGGGELARGGEREGEKRCGERGRSASSNGCSVCARAASIRQYTT